MQTQTLIQELAAHLQRPVDAETQARARLHLTDWIGCAVAGAVEPAGKIALSQAGAGVASRAFAWGMLGNILEMDDVDKRALLHPGPSIIPATLALAIELGASEDVTLSAIVRGYEATIRLGRAVGPAHYAIWHNTATCGPIGAAAACASLLDLSEEKTAHALALAMSQFSGVWQTRHEPASMGKQLHTAHAARAGLDAARLAEAGFKGPLTILEGPQGFFVATCPGADPADVLRGAGNCLIHDVSFKPWPACRHAHAAIDAALIARQQVADPSAISAITVETYKDALEFCDKPSPETPIEAKFSLQHSVAATLLRGPLALSDFAPAAINDPDIAALRRQITVNNDDEITARYPAHFGASLVIDDNPAVEITDAWGDPENPVTPGDITRKAEDLLTAGGIGDDQRAALLSGPFEDLLAALQKVLA